MILASDLRPGQHIAVLGADAAGKAETEPAALAGCRLFCDEWRQASTGGELSGRRRGRARSPRTTSPRSAPVLLGEAPGRGDADEITLFDSTGLAIQDLAIAHAVLAAHGEGLVTPPNVRL